MDTNIKTFKNITDQDIFDNYIKANENSDYKVRLTVKGIIIDQNNYIALLKVSNLYLLPGGGVQEGESYEEAFKREVMEEVGCNLKDIKIIGSSNQFRNKPMKNYATTFLVAYVDGEKLAPTTTQEDEK